MLFPLKSCEKSPLQYENNFSIKSYSTLNMPISIPPSRTLYACLHFLFSMTLYGHVFPYKSKAILNVDVLKFVKHFQILAYILTICVLFGIFKTLDILCFYIEQLSLT